MSGLHSAEQLHNFMLLVTFSESYVPLSNSRDFRDEENYSIQQSHITLKKKQTKEKQNKINNKKNMTRNTSPLSDPRKKAKHPPPPSP